MAPFRAQLKQNDNDVFYSETHLLDDSNYEKMIDMLNDGLSQTDASKEIGLNKSTISRYAKKRGNQGGWNNVSLLHVIGKQHATFFARSFVKNRTEL